jgi:hypothetical protein
VPYQNSGSQPTAGTRGPRRGGREGIPAWATIMTGTIHGRYARLRSPRTGSGKRVTATLRLAAAVGAPGRDGLAIEVQPHDRHLLALSAGSTTGLAHGRGPLPRAPPAATTAAAATWTAPPATCSPAPRPRSLSWRGMLQYHVYCGPGPEPGSPPPETDWPDRVTAARARSPCGWSGHRPR